MPRLPGGGQRHHQNVRVRQQPVQLLVGVYRVKRRVCGPFRPPHAPNARGSHGLGPARKLRSDVPRAQHGDGTADDRPHGQHLAPALCRRVGAVRHLMPQQHQRHHDQMLRDGHAIRAGGIGQHHLRAGIQPLVQIGVHPGEAAAEPLQVHEILQLRGLGHPVDHLVLPSLFRRHGLGRFIVIHREAVPGGGVVDHSPMLRFSKIVIHGDFSHLLYTSHIFSAQRIPSAAADRMPPA